MLCVKSEFSKVTIHFYSHPNSGTNGSMCRRFYSNLNLGSYELLQHWSQYTQLFRDILGEKQDGEQRLSKRKDLKCLKYDAHGLPLNEMHKALGLPLIKAVVHEKKLPFSFLRTIFHRFMTHNLKEKKK